jgi:benzoyl-CoA 2,3-dioxygenase component B
MFVGDTGVNRVVQRTAELMNAHGDDGVRKAGGIPLDLLQRYINLWYSLSLDLFGGEISSNASNYFATGLKGRYREGRREEHLALDQFYKMPVIEGEKIVTQDVPLRNAMNEVLRDAYVDDCMKGLARWNKSLTKAGLSDRLTVPDRKFHRNIGIYSDTSFTPEGVMVSSDEFEAKRGEWLPSEADETYVATLMQPVVKPGQMASWIAPPPKGINGQVKDFEYVRL